VDIIKNKAKNQHEFQLDKHSSSWRRTLQVGEGLFKLEKDSSSWRRTVKMKGIPQWDTGHTHGQDDEVLHS